MKKILIITIVTMVSFSIHASDLIVKRAPDTFEKYITLKSLYESTETAPDGYQMPFYWTFILTDKYAEFRFFWPNGNRMEAPSNNTEYTISSIDKKLSVNHFKGYTPDGYIIRVVKEDWERFKNTLSKADGALEFAIIQHDYRSSLLHSPRKYYEMDKVDFTGINDLFMKTFNEELQIQKPNDSSKYILGIVLGPGLVPFGNNPEEVNVRIGIAAIYLPYKNNLFSLGIRADVAPYTVNLQTRKKLFDISASLYMSNYFYINPTFSMRLEYGIGGGYIYNPATSRYPVHSFSIRVPLALSFIINNNWNIALDFIIDNMLFSKETIPTTSTNISGGISARYGF